MTEWSIDNRPPLLASMHEFKMVHLANGEIEPPDGDGWFFVSTVTEPPTPVDDGDFVTEEWRPGSIFVIWARRK